MAPRDPRGHAINTHEQLPSLKVRVVHRETSAHAEVWLRAGQEAALDIGYRSLHAGPHDVWVMLDGNPLPGCPYHVVVRPNVICPEATIFSGKAWT